MIDPHLLFRVAFGLLGAGMMYVAGCRFAPMSKQCTLARIRHAALGLFAAGLLMVGAVTVWPAMLPWATLSAPAAALGWMVATSHAWRHGQPLSAMRGGGVLLPFRARADGWSATRPMTQRERRRVVKG